MIASATNFDTLVPLELLAAGDWAEIADVSGEPSWVCRLAELGLRNGSRVQVLQPGSPCLLRIGGGRLSLRPDQGLQILVRPAAGPSA
jgi:Fe2+ transport system protein FeoA